MPADASWPQLRRRAPTAADRACARRQSAFWSSCQLRPPERKRTGRPALGPGGRPAIGSAPPLRSSALKRPSRARPERRGPEGSGSPVGPPVERDDRRVRHPDRGAQAPLRPYRKLLRRRRRASIRAGDTRRTGGRRRGWYDRLRPPTREMAGLASPPPKESPTNAPPGGCRQTGELSATRPEPSQTGPPPAELPPTLAPR